MSEVLDQLIAALTAHRQQDGKTASDHYFRAMTCAMDIQNYDVRCIAAFCQKFLWYHYNGTRAGHGMEHNGERLVLEAMARLGARTIFDVGANIGYWAQTASALNPAAEIHAFEIFPDTHARLAANLKDRPQVHCNPFGLSAQDGTVDVFYGDAADSVYFSSISSDPSAKRRPCPVRRGDAYAAEHGITAIDFLKIDVEGAEYDVLEGFRGMLSAGRIPVVQFEYGPASIVSHKLLRDFDGFFRELGFTMGRLYPRGVLFKEYAAEDDNFVNSNLIACRTDRRDAIELLSYR